MCLVFIELNRRNELIVITGKLFFEFTFALVYCRERKFNQRRLDKKTRITAKRVL